jgi:hypothetical protein
MLVGVPALATCVVLVTRLDPTPILALVGCAVAGLSMLALYLLLSIWPLRIDEVRAIRSRLA